MVVFAATRAGGSLGGLAGLALAACAAAQTPVPLTDLQPGQQFGAATARGGVVLPPDVGGVSAIDVAADGASALLISDRGGWVTVALSYDGGGDLAGAAVTARGRLIGPDGKALARKVRSDAEGLARLADGTLLVSFERDHRLLAYPPAAPPFSRPPRVLAAPAALDDGPRNGGLEALAVLSDGRLLALAEQTTAAGFGADLGAAWLGTLDGGVNWQPLARRRSDGFRPSGAATLPGGDVIVLERRFIPPAGLSARLVRVPARTIVPGATLAGIELARLGPPDIAENFEGIAARATPDGTHVYVVSDDNFSPLLRSVLLMLEVPG